THGNHRLAALAVRRKGNLGRVPSGGDGAHVVAVRPVARKRGDIGEFARAHRVETGDRPSMDAPTIGVVVPLAGQYARCREARAQHRDRYSQNKDESLHLTSTLPPLNTLSSRPAHRSKGVTRGPPARGAGLAGVYDRPIRDDRHATGVASPASTSAVTGVRSSMVSGRGGGASV